VETKIGRLKEGGIVFQLVATTELLDALAKKAKAAQQARPSNAG
jgi:hypothetical protein